MGGIITLRIKNAINNIYYQLRGESMRTIELYLKLKSLQQSLPEIYDNDYKQSIARAIIFTNGSIDEVEFLTSADKMDIISVYQQLKNEQFDFNVSNEQKAMSYVNNLHGDTKTKSRSFKRTEMINFVKEKLIKSHSDIEFIHLKYNVLTCKLNNQTYTVYVSTSRDYEFLNTKEEINPKRVSAWHKGNDEIFSSYDYYAMLVKIDSKSEYVTEQSNGIEGIFMNQQELNTWLNEKEKNQSGMINCYVHYHQPKSNREIIEVIDARERPQLNLRHLLDNTFKL